MGGAYGKIIYWAVGTKKKPQVGALRLFFGRKIDMASRYVHNDVNTETRKGGGNMCDKRRVTIRIPESTAERLYEAANARGVSVNALVILSIEDYLRKLRRWEKSDD